jgi:K+-transporting ATPase KdpF subunit
MDARDRELVPWSYAWVAETCRNLNGGGKGKMNIVYLIAGIIALALLAYLFVALLKPEWFA